VRGQQPLPDATARGDMRGASGTIAFMQLVPLFLNGRAFNAQFKNARRRKSR